MSDIDENKLRRLDGGLLLVFRELLRTGRASQAAGRLGLSQPAISHALTRLRDLFDDPLFVRRPHGFEPTRRALDLGPQVEALIALAGDALSPDARFDASRSRRAFRFGAPEFVTALIGAELLERLRRVAPGVTFMIGHADEDQAFNYLRRGEADFALGVFGAARPGFVVEPFLQDEYCAVARAGHPTIQGGLTEPQWRDTGHIYAWSASETGTPGPGNTFPEGVRALATVPHWLTVLLLVASSDGIGTVPRRLAERQAARLGLQVLDMPFPPDRITVSLMRRSGATDPGADWFLGQVRAAAGV
jgi:DNA-binding transcriptional LysR family regulator